MDIYQDNGAARGLRTRVFRDCQNGLGVEWMYASDYASGSDRWYGYGIDQSLTMRKLMDDAESLVGSHIARLA